MSTYGFLTDEEAKIFALNEQRYLIKDIKEKGISNLQVGNFVRYFNYFPSDGSINITWIVRNAQGETTFSDIIYVEPFAKTTYHIDY
jgi:hypothetical protein